MYAVAAVCTLWRKHTHTHTHTHIHTRTHTNLVMMFGERHMGQHAEIHVGISIVWQLRLRQEFGTWFGVFCGKQLRAGTLVLIFCGSSYVVWLLICCVAARILYIAWLLMCCVAAHMLCGCSCVAWLLMCCVASHMLCGCSCVVWLLICCVAAHVLRGCSCIVWLLMCCVAAHLLICCVAAHYSFYRNWQCLTGGRVRAVWHTLSEQPPM